MSFVSDIFEALFRALFGQIKKKPKTLEVGEVGGEFEDKVKEQIDDQIPDGPGGRK